MADSTYFMKSTPPRVFDVSFENFAYMHTDILKMCLWKLNDENIVFYKFTPFLT